MEPIGKKGGGSNKQERKKRKTRKEKENPDRQISTLNKQPSSKKKASETRSVLFRDETRQDNTIYLGNQPPGILNRTSRRTLQLHLPVRFAPLLPRVQALARLDAQGVVPLLDDLVDLPGAEVLLPPGWDGSRVCRSAVCCCFALLGMSLRLEQEGMEVRGYGDQGVDGGDVFVPTRRRRLLAVGNGRG